MSKAKTQISLQLPEALKLEFDFHLNRAGAKKTGVIREFVVEYIREKRAWARGRGMPDYVPKVRE